MNRSEGRSESDVPQDITLRDACAEGRRFAAPYAAGVFAGRGGVATDCVCFAAGTALKGGRRLVRRGCRPRHRARKNKVGEDYRPGGEGLGLSIYMVSLRSL